MASSVSRTAPVNGNGQPANIERPQSLEYLLRNRSALGTLCEIEVLGKPISICDPMHNDGATLKVGLPVDLCGPFTVYITAEKPEWIWERYQKKAEKGKMTTEEATKKARAEIMANGVALDLLAIRIEEEMKRSGSRTAKLRLRLQLRVFPTDNSQSLPLFYIFKRVADGKLNNVEIVREQQTITSYNEPKPPEALARQ